MAQYSENLLYANLAIQRVERALRQERRSQREWRRYHRVSDTTQPESTGAMPLRWVRAHQHLEDEIYFLVVAVSRAIKGRELLEHRGAAMPGFRQRDAVMAWRDIAEHWDEPGKGMEGMGLLLHHPAASGGDPRRQRRRLADDV
jgi:hypothetical protein